MTTRRHACAPATRQAVRGDRAQHRIAAQLTAAGLGITPDAVQRAVIRHWAATHHNRQHRHERQEPTVNDTDTRPSVTEVRTALIRDTSDFYRRRQPHHTAMRNAPKGDPHFNAVFDAYEGLVTAGCYAEALATVLRIVEQRHPETANDLASLVHEVRENGNDCLEDANADVWALIEREADAANAAAKQDETAPAEDGGPTCRDCGTWPCARHATDADRAEYAQATESEAGR